MNTDYIYFCSPINAIVEGIYEEKIPFTHIKTQGDFGLGTFDHLDGEMVMLDGNIYQMTADGKVNKADENTLTPFSCVTFYRPLTEEFLEESLSYQAFLAWLENLLPSRNIFYALRIEGYFEHVKVRSVPKSENYKPLVEVAQTQPEFEFSQIRGTLAGFYTPSYMSSISVPGLHLHFVGFKAGNNKANHSHLDLGSFVFDAAGVRWAVDLGADDYNLPGYFGNQRWNYYRLRAEGQNTLVINPGDQPDQDPAAAAQIVRFQPGTDRAFAVADLSTAYRTSARKVWRGIALLDRAKVVVQDEIQADKPVELWWFMHTPASVKIEDDGRTATLQQVGKKLRAEILSPTEARFQLMDAQPLPASPHPERQAKNANTRKLAIHMAGIRNSVLTVVLTPNPSMDEASVQQVKVSTLSDW